MYQYIYENGLPSATWFQLNPSIPPTGALSMQQRWFRYFSKASCLKSQTGSFSLTIRKCHLLFTTSRAFYSSGFPLRISLRNTRTILLLRYQITAFYGILESIKDTITYGELCHRFSCNLYMYLSISANWVAVQTVAVFSGENIPNKTWKLINNCM